MNIPNKIIAALFTLLLVFPATFFASPAHAQTAAPRIDGFDVEQVHQLTAGTELDFTLYGTPGGSATIFISGTSAAFALREVEIGLYEGIYTVKSRDRIPAERSVTANLRLGNYVTSAILAESLLLASAYHSPAQQATDAAFSARPTIDRFEVSPVRELSPGSYLHFTVYGTPGAQANVRISGAKGAFFLTEESKGVYSGAYAIKNRDRILANSVVTGNLRLGKQTATATLGKTLVSATAPLSASRRTAVCANCGEVVAVNVIEVQGEGSYVGLILGGIAGGAVGSQVGQGTGTTVAEIAGAIGGAYAGRELEKNMKKTKHDEVVVRLQGGGTQTFTYAGASGFRVGDKVKVVNGALVRE